MIIRFHIDRCSVGGLFASFILSMGGVVYAEGGAAVSPGWNDVKSQLRWPLVVSNSQKKDEGVLQTVEQLLAEGNEPKAIELLKSSVGGLSPDEFTAKITADGATKETLDELRLARDVAYQFALLGALTGDEKYRDSAKRILFRFAEVMPEWPFYSGSGERHERKDRAYARGWKSNGIWLRWHPLDLGESLSLLKTYDLLKGTLSDDERATLRERIFFQHKNTIQRFTGLSSIYHNLSGYHLVPLIRFGIVLERPDYIHEVVRYWKEMLQYSYAADGFFRELSPDYHQQISRRIIGSIPALLKGYSDPEGYADPVDGSRFDNLDLAKDEAARIEPIAKALNPLVLPDGNYLALNDSTPKKMRAEEASKGDSSELLGVSGVAKIGAGGMAAYLSFDGIRGHDHFDALNLSWFAGGREVLGETAYRSIPNTNSTREWHTITASHHTVAVDEKSHFSDRGSLSLPRNAGAVAAQPLKDGGFAEGRNVAAHLPAAARFTNQGKLLVWDGSNEKVQAMEAEQERAYPGITSLFRRTVVMLPTDQGEGILIDLFRVRGGKKHDSFLRGGYDVSSIAFNHPLEPSTGTLFSYIQVKEAAPVGSGWVTTIAYPDGFSTASHLAGLWGGEAVKQELLAGTAPGFIKGDEKPIAVFRRESTDGEVLESCFLFVHEAGKKKQIKKLSATPDGMNVVVSIERDGGRDLIFSGLSSDSSFDYEGWQFTGSLAYAREVSDERSGHVFKGGSLKHASQLVAEGRGSFVGKVVATSRKEAGDALHSIVVAADAEVASRPYRLAHVDFGDVVRFSIPVVSLTKEGDGQVRVELAHSPGFILNDEGASMTQFPGWRVAGDIQVTLE